MLLVLLLMLLLKSCFQHPQALCRLICVQKHQRQKTRISKNHYLFTSVDTADVRMYIYSDAYIYMYTHTKWKVSTFCTEIVFPFSALEVRSCWMRTVFSSRRTTSLFDVSCWAATVLLEHSSYSVLEIWYEWHEHNKALMIYNLKVDFLEYSLVLRCKTSQGHSGSLVLPPILPPAVCSSLHCSKLNYSRPNAIQVANHFCQSQACWLITCWLRALSSMLTQRKTQTCWMRIMHLRINWHCYSIYVYSNEE